mmetsp:Transcript_15406/g.31584  ORF Transcript_15406/g.31584 Transcript_15406/m.31584 type:complete len:724 (-) Transcript_15406:68-2239(-)
MTSNSRVLCSHTIATRNRKKGATKAHQKSTHRTNTVSVAMPCMSLHRIGDDLLEGVGSKSNPVRLVELALELDPVQTKGVEEALQDVHHQQDTKGDGGKQTKAEVGGKPVDGQGGKHALLPKDLCQLRVGKRQRPETQVRGGVGDHSQDKLDGFDRLVDDDLPKTVFLVAFSSVAIAAWFFVVFAVGRVDDLVAVSSDALADAVGLGHQQGGDGDQRQEQQDVLDARLALVQGFFDAPGSQGDVDERGDQCRWLAPVSGTTVVQGTLLGGRVLAGAAESPGGAVAVPVARSANGVGSVAGVGPVRLPLVTGRVVAGRHRHAVVPVDAPLQKDHKDHVQKERCGKDGHREHLEVQVEGLLEVDRVDALQDDTEAHLNDSQNDAQLHLEGIEKEELVGCHVPHRVQPKHVNGLVAPVGGDELGDVALLDVALVLSLEAVGRAKEVEAEGETIVVDKSRVDGKESHHQQHVPGGVHPPGELVGLGPVLDGLLVPDQKNPRQEQKGAVADVSVHDTEQEGKGSGRKERRVRLSVTGNPVGVDEFLVGVGELVGDKVRGGGHRPRLREGFHQGRNRLVHAGVGPVDRVDGVHLVFRNDPSLSPQHPGDVRLEHVHGVVDRLFLEDNPGPLLAVLGELLADLVPGFAVLQEDRSRIDELSLVFFHQFVDRVRVFHVGQVVPVRQKGVADPLELGPDRRRLVKDEKDGLFRFLAGFRIDRRVVDGCKADQ